MSGLVRARVRGVEKNISRALAEANEDIEILEDQDTHLPDGQVRPPERVAKPEAADPAPTEPPYAKRKKDDLVDLVDARNDARGEDEPQIVVEGKGTIADLAAALEADDARQAEALANTPPPADGAGDTQEALR